jgi:hypothetical protein
MRRMLNARNIWAVTNTDSYPDSIWLQVGHYAVMMLTEEQIWLSLDKQLTESPVREDMVFTSANRWGWQPQEGDLYQYKDKFKPGNPFSINGYYKPVSEESHDKIYPELKRLHFEFLYKVAVVGQSMHKETQNLHLPGILIYLRNELSKACPRSLV